MTSPFTPVFNNPQHIKLLEEYLNDRCLEPSDFPEGLVPVADKNILAELGYITTQTAGRPFIFLQYLDPNGQPYLDREGNKPYRLARFLGAPTLWDKPKPPSKVIAPNDRPNVLHFEPIQPIEGEARDWHSLKDGQIVVHVESMVKARAVSKWTGFPTIGYNGVNSYSSSKRGVELIHKQYDVDFTRLRHVILFDSNVWKPEVASARQGLMFKLKHVLGCRDIAYVDLPKGKSGEDVGPDDFLAQFGNQPLIDLIRSATDYKGEEHDELLQEMLDRAVFCTQGGTIIDRGDKVVRTVERAGTFYKEVNLKTLKRNQVVTVYGFNLWLDSKGKTKVVNPGYEYLGGEFIERPQGLFYNRYTRGGVWPEDIDERGDAGPIIAHLTKMMSESDLRLLRSYLKYVKHSKEKPTSFPVMYSEKRGVGKGWFTKLAYRLVGDENTTSADAKAFVSNFNAQLANKRLVIVNEFKVKPGEKDAAINSIKRFTGDEFLVVEPKGVDSYSVENLAGMIITANKLEDVPTDGIEDRRMWYIECFPVEGADWEYLHPLLNNKSVMNSVADWIEAGEDINFASWKPPLDEARERAIMASSSSLEHACRTVLHDLQEDGENKWVCVNYELVVELVKREGVPFVENITGKMMTNTMRQMGWVPSEKKYGKNGAQKKVWIIDIEAFAAIDTVGTKISAEVARAAQYFVGHSKY